MPTTLWKEIRKQLTNCPSFALDIPRLEKVEPAHLEHVQAQIEKALKNHAYPFIFLVGPLGSGKTTHIRHFIHTHPTFSYTYKSFVKVNNLDQAFLHLTNYISRSFILALVVLIALLIMYLIPGTSALPLLVITGYLFTKNAGNLAYIFHETLDYLFTRKHRIIILEDLERSSLDPKDQWALLANLWLLNRTYFISLGYPWGDRKAELSTIEYAEKLEGFIVEILPYKQLNFSVIKKLDPDFPLTIDPNGSQGDWISLFTPREMIMIKDEVLLKITSHRSQINKKNQYIHTCLDLLLAKLGLLKGVIEYDEHTKTLKPSIPKEMSSEQSHFIASFAESVAI